MYQIISLILVAVGIMMLFAIDYFISKDSQDTTLKMIRDNNKLISVAFLGLAYYVYPFEKRDSSSSVDESVNELPSYEEATSE